MAPMEYTMMPTLPQRECVALLVLRLGLGSFLLFWSIDKLVAPEGTVRIFATFYYLSISPALAYGIGVVEAILSVLIIMGVWKRYTYAIGLGLHTLLTLSTWKQILNPFEPNPRFLSSQRLFCSISCVSTIRCARLIGEQRKAHCGKGNIMAVFLRIIGGVLLFFGLGNIIGAPWGMNVDGLTASQRLLNGGVLVLPGIVLFGVADVVQKKMESIS